MKKEKIQEIIDMKNRLLLVLGYGAAIMFELRHYLPQDKKDGLNWYLEAINNIVYMDKPLPPMPNKK